MRLPDKLKNAAASAQRSGKSKRVALDGSPASYNYRVNSAIRLVGNLQQLLHDTLTLLFRKT
ncbi:hypothetical protein GCM10011488_40160 [Steroidobacter agaridevorans]|nr:hypothetical protein GCM10011488_40160 [Steroidobacter agaridevorans]